MNARLVTLYCACLLLGVTCGEQAVQDGISARLIPKVRSLVRDEIIRPESGRAARNEVFVGFPPLVPGKNFEQAPTLALTDVSKDEFATLEKELWSAFSAAPKAVDFEGKNGLQSKISNRILSAKSQAKEERDSRESGFPSGDRRRQLDGVASWLETVTDSLLKGKEGGRQPRDLPGLFDPQKLLNLPDLLFKNGNSENNALPGLPGLHGLPGLPGQPIRKFIEFLREKLTHKQEETTQDRPEDHLLLKRLFQRGKELTGNVQENV